MSHQLQPGRHITCSVPASTANLGAGFDSLGLALGLYDTVEVITTDAGLDIEVHGEGAGEVPRDSSHLVYRALEAGLSAAGITVAGLKIICHNRIPHSRGLGSSAAAAVAGVALAQALTGDALDSATLLQLASEFEGHPDNAAASLFGGAIISWSTAGESKRYQAVTTPVHPDLKATAFVPSFHASTHEVRKVLPASISHLDARFNISRAALMVAALNEHPEHLQSATEDVLHQPYRAAVLEQTASWIERLRDKGYAAYLSGAGPTCMVLGTTWVDQSLIDEAVAAGLQVLTLEIAGGVSTKVIA
ncbi:homoserine kinase [Corynebacterium sp. ES2794-CONJ1]|uniref:homoserine kinase n=1 Tax=unclassified Corynebacterium TaxID=2624378 RepID=UPI00216B0B7D|nr:MULTISPECIES: homoserine kinase [unclassified Corynebacterium]MCS4531908.1 homoserine kinase [Corynebacterium sp. ES2730-CONJ]MCU9519309.1 homoserine kinase [Corynebacterium sp. ES2794-CONJ1]